MSHLSYNHYTCLENVTVFFSPCNCNDFLLFVDIVFIEIYGNELWQVITTKEIKPLLTFYIKYYKFDWTVCHFS